MFRRLKCMIRKEFLQMLRDPRMRGIVFVMPVIQMVVIAFALTTDVTHIRTALLDQDQSPASRALTEAFTAGGYFEIVAIAREPAELGTLLDAGEVRAALSIPAGFENDIASGRGAEVQLAADATDSNTTAIAFGYANQIARDFAAARQLERLRTLMPGLSPGEAEMATRAWYNPNLESKYYFVPGLIAVMLMVVSLVMTSIAIVREKEIGTIEQLMVTPIRRLELVIGKTIPFLIVGYIIMTSMFLIAMLVFGVRNHGSFPLLCLLTGVYLCGNLGLALLISVSASTQQQALLTAFFFLLPGVLLSGFIFPVHNMPIWVQYATWVNPMRWYMEILRGILIKGVGAGVLWHAILAQVTLAVTFILVAAIRFKKTVA